MSPDSITALIAGRLRPLDAPPPGAPRGDHDLNPGSERPAVPLREAAVLVPIVLRPEGPTVLFTQRAADLPSHPGQISFPGGRIEPGDPSPAAAALREAQEEIALDPDFATPAGLLDPYETGTGYRIAPVVALVRPGFVLKADPREVAAIFEAPFAFLMDAANHQRHSGVWRGRERHYYAIPYGERYIWGATAGMLVNLHERLGLR